ncbi:unnamed protein product [Peniophora sp. CBMAI 1063]|nr:unnamed protein product [Peniophora sp. CBMAI 1063]
MSSASVPGSRIPSNGSQPQPLGGRTTDPSPPVIELSDSNDEEAGTPRAGGSVFGKRKAVDGHESSKRARTLAPESIGPGNGVVGAYGSDVMDYIEVLKAEAREAKEHAEMEAIRADKAEQELSSCQKQLKAYQDTPLMDMLSFLVVCPICDLLMLHVAHMSCGHDICVLCARRYFTWSLKEQLKNRLDFRPGYRLPMIPQDMFDAHPHPIVLKVFTQVNYLKRLQPEYKCPCCRTPLLEPPTKSLALSEIAEKMRKLRSPEDERLELEKLEVIKDSGMAVNCWDEWFGKIDE